MRNLLLFSGLLICFSCSQPQQTNKENDPAKDGKDSFATKSPDKINDSSKQGDNLHLMQGNSADQEKKKEDKLWDEKLKQYLDKANAEEQEKILESNYLFEQADAFSKNGDLERSRDLCRKAITLWSNNDKAKALLSELDSIVTGRHTDIESKEALDTFAAQIEGALREIVHHMKTGEKLYSSGDYEKALKEFKEAEFKVIAIPQGIAEKAEFDTSIKDYLNRIKHDIDMQRKKMEYELRKEMIAEQQALEEAEKKQVIDKVASLLELSFLSFDQRQFDKVILLCDKILDLDPNYIVARNLKEDAYKAKDKYEYKDIAMKKIWGWKAMLRENKEAKIPFQDILKFPDRKKWREVQKRADDLATQDIISDRESASELKKKTQSDIETKRLSLVQMDGNKSLEEIIADLQVQTGLQVMLDPEVKNPPDGVAEKPDVEKPMPAFSLKNIPIKKYLEIILDNYSLDFFIDETGII
ncbi:MAG: hypothetical protein HY606_15000, partial [Planctomycetes bacterium]|nr:hypothetical protein [Planctomycetota bacterium]